jgi:dolichyl-diphosphooligosaccharide---protein glycosyltransferase
LSVAQDSKEWVEKNRICDAPGSWFCRGQYPPALTKILKEKKNFKQLEDFNVKDGDDSEYQKKYFENLHNPNAIEYTRKDDKRKEAKRTEAKHKEEKPKAVQKLSRIEIEMLNEEWRNNEMTTALHNIIQQGNVEHLRGALIEEPKLAHVRSEDGRGPMFWAHEYGKKEIVKLLKEHGVSETWKDKDGKTPLDGSALS